MSSVEPSKPDAFERWDKRIGRVYTRLFSIPFWIIGIWCSIQLLRHLGSDPGSLLFYLFGAGFGLLLARWLWRLNEGILYYISDGFATRYKSEVDKDPKWRRN